MKRGSDEKIACIEMSFILNLDCLLGSGSPNFNSHAFTIIPHSRHHNDAGGTVAM